MPKYLSNRNVLNFNTKRLMRLKFIEMEKNKVNGLQSIQLSLFSHNILATAKLQPF